MRFLAPILFVFLGLNLFLAGCSTDETFGSDPLESLTFSADTLSFDTVFSTVGTTTAWLKIYNTGKQKIRISDISLKNGRSSYFRVNVDGDGSLPVKEVDLLPKDSLFVFVALTTPETGSNKPFLMEDALIFQAEGKQKQIVLQAYSQDAILWRGKTIHADTVLTADKPFLIYDSLVVDPGVTLTLREGVTFYLHDAATVLVRGTIKALGSQNAPITFRGDRLDKLFSDLPYEYYPGQWNALYLAASSFENELDHVVIRGGYSGVIADSSNTDKVKLKMTNSIVHNVIDYCLWSCNNQMLIANSQITNSGQNTVCLLGGQYDFTHCTLANHQSSIFVNREGSTLLLSGSRYGEDSPALPLQAYFNNCIVWGSGFPEIDTLSTHSAVWNVKFNYCLLKTNKWPIGMDDKTIYYPLEPKFLRQDLSDGNYAYDFHIDSLSDARSIASMTYANEYPYDLDGISRVGDGKPDIGAYQWVSSKK